MTAIEERHVHSGLPSRLIDVDPLLNPDEGWMSREIFVNEDIFKQELENVFARSWLFVGHETQIPNPGDFFVSRMGVDSVILTRDAQGGINVLLNTCRHRGMKVCRYDEGNTTQFYCPFHGWTYSTDGALVTYPGELYGVPHFQTSYGGALDKSKWGLVSCPQVENYRGLIFATWDPEAPTFREYIGDYYHWLDSLGGALDGSEDGTEAIAGVQKWRVHSNWKIIAENFIGDSYHGTPTHVSVEAVGIGPGGRSKTRHGRPREESHTSATSFVDLGHGASDHVDAVRPYPLDSFVEPELNEYFRNAWEQRLQRRRAEGRPIGAMGPSTMFPSFSFHAAATPRTILVSHPISATETEMWRWCIVDRKAPEIVKEWLRHHYLRYSGPAGMTEQDDMENWDYATNASAGTIARRYDYCYELGLGQEKPAEKLHGAIESTVRPTETQARNFYRRWARVVNGESWDSLLRPSTR